MTQLWADLALVAVFIGIGGVFAATELALVSLRESQLAGLAARSARGARVAAVARDPNTFLAAVQIGVTVCGFLSAAYGATALAPYLAPALRGLGLDALTAQSVAVVLMTLVVAYASLVFGELAPKRLALQRAEAFALVVAPPLAALSRALRPLIWLLGRSTDLVVRLLGGDPNRRGESMSDDELRSLVDTHETLGDEERSIVREVLDAADRSVVEVMRPRGDMVALRSDMTVGDARSLVRAQPYSRYPIMRQGADDIDGFLHVRDLAWADDLEAPVESLSRPVTLVPGTARVLPTLTAMRAEGAHLAIVIDEYGGTDGLVTLEDLVEELIGEVYDEHDPADRMRAAERAEASGPSTVRGELTLDRFTEATGLALAAGPYETVAGYLIARLGRLAVQGDAVEIEGATLTAIVVRRRRIVEVRVERRPADVPAP